jgi:hypothetical protein
MDDRLGFRGHSPVPAQRRYRVPRTAVEAGQVRTERLHAVIFVCRGAKRVNAGCGARTKHGAIGSDNDLLRESQALRDSRHKILSLAHAAMDRTHSNLRFCPLCRLQSSSRRRDPPY